MLFILVAIESSVNLCEVEPVYGSNRQVLRLNKIEIGQFLNMKNKLGTPNNTIAIIANPNNSGNSLYPSRMLPVKADNPTVDSTNNKTLGARLAVSNSTPSLFLKIVPSIKVVFEKYLTNSGTPMIVSQNVTAAEYGKSCLCGSEPTIANVTANPPLIPNQKTKFQNLSLVSHLVLGLLACSRFSISNLWFKVHSIIVLKFAKYIKQIMSYILGVSLICSSCCMNTLAIDIDKKYTVAELKEMISTLEVDHKIPKGLLAAIAKIESGNKAYALNMGGTSYIAKSIDEAANVVSEKITKGYTNIDVGVMQLNYRWHGGGFDSIEEMLTPIKNITYAAKLLVSLKKQHGDWHKAVRYYHSATPEHHKKYSRKVVLCWLNS